MASSPSFEARADALYALPLDEFVAERKRLGDELKREGAAAEARAFLALAKPTVSAWLTNQTVRRAPALVQSLVAATDAVAAAQRTAPGVGGSPQAFQAAVGEQRRLVAELSEVARTTAAALMPGGGAATAIDRVDNNLRWGTIAGPDREAFVAGRLVRDVTAPGFGGFGEAEAATPAARTTPAPPTPSDAETRREAEAVRARARSAADAAAAAAAEREHRRLVAHHEAELRRLQAEITRARRDRTNLEADRRKADERTTFAEAALAAARQARDTVDEQLRTATEAVATLEGEEADLRRRGPAAPAAPNH